MGRLWSDLGPIKMSARCQYYLKLIIPKPCFWQILSESVPPLPIAQAKVCRRLAGKELWGFEPLFYRLERSTCRLYSAVDSTLPVEKSTCRFNSGTLLHRERGRRRLHWVCNTPENAANQPSNMRRRGWSFNGCDDDGDDYWALIGAKLIVI